MAFINTHHSSFSRNAELQITPWDLFICVAGRPEGISLSRLAHVLHVEQETSLIRPLLSLAEQGLVLDGGKHFSLANNKKAQGLKLTMSYALAYEYDYNAYLETDMTEFLRKAYRADYFTGSDISKNLMIPEVITRLIQNSLVIIYSYNPFQGKIIQNPFLDGICEYLGFKRSKGLFRRSIQLDTVIKNKLEAGADDPQIGYCKEIIGEKCLKETNWGLGATPQIIKASVEKEDTETFDPKSTSCYDNAWNKMHSNIAANVPLTVDCIKEYHRLAMANTEFGGVFRTHSVQIRNNPNFKTADMANIPALLEQFASQARGSKTPTLMQALDLAAYLYNQFIFIHPFEDGNSRTARIILAHILNQHKVPFEKIPSSYEVRFLQATKGYKKRDDSELKYLLEEVYLTYINKDELRRAAAK
ncbi:MAG: Fic family protein [bacterium]|nr:Fic family protein [bacterium]